MIESFGSNPIGPKHLRRTADWIRKLRPEADDALLIAGSCHDIERSPKHRVGKLEVMLEITGKEYLKKHQERSGRIMRDFLLQAGADPNFAKRVENLIAKHEEGGDDDQNLLKDADSVSFFENNIDHFFNDMAGTIGKEGLLRKFQWMFERITLKKAEALARPFYLKAMKRLEKYDQLH